MPSLIPRWKKKKPSTFRDLSPSDRDYLVGMLQATPPNQSEASSQPLQHQEEPELHSQDEPAPTQSPPTPPPDEPTIPKPTFESSLRMANETVKCWERRDTRIANSIKAKLASKFSLEINSYMKEYAAKTRAVSSRQHIHRIVEQCVLARRNLREIRDLLQDLQDYDPVDDVTRMLMEETWRVMVSLEHDNWIEVEYALENQ
ncbi:uncharacterized protein N7496_008375 [Penicillium cataractarum]|uniref:Uncharacterized protein n=1 Tax=Penicillium cataractarum TaxID=2100454 RepID=A0A9W9RYH4_9EURO|nr:uncharacterized protein N7496_008375 [Penicillium cataractarum]KAJ5368615.1 hypothetical protein N7496_008375 [Penicillium cataractarum]